MQVDQQEALQARISQLEKRLKAAETQCQTTTKEIWQMEVDLARMEERAQQAEEQVQRLEAGLHSAPVAPPDAALAEVAQDLELLAEEKAVAEEARRIAEDALTQAEAENREYHLRQQQQQQRIAQLEQQHLEVEAANEQLQAAMQQVELTEQMWSQAEKRCQEVRSQINLVQEDLERARQELLTQQEHFHSERQQFQRALEQAQSQALQSGQTSEELTRLQENLRLQTEKSSLLQQRLDQVQGRLASAEERAEALQAQAHRAESRLAEMQSHSGGAEEELRQLRERLERMETRVRDADKIYEVSEQQIREAELKQQESWQRVRDAESRANQALVENKKLSDRIGEYERRAQEADLETQRLAFQDPLTGLPNINLITQYLEFTVKQCVRYRRVAALLIIDIDRFKVFNEAMGTKAGDELLAKVAERLQQAIRETDSLGRKGEDEFIILLSELNVGEHQVAEARRRAIQQHVEVVANRVMQIMGPPFTVQGQKFYLNVSVGVAICPDDGETPQALLENADTAMYHVKETGRNRHQFYTTDLRQRQEKRLSLDMQMRSALDRGEFEVRFQPVVSLAKGKGTLVGVEALLRWNHRMEGTVTPDYFLPAAEESGMIVPIGQWVLSQTCNQMREWLGMGLRIFASINLSKRQLLQADLVECIARELSLNGIPPEVLYVDIAEGFNTFNPEIMDQVINRLGSAGIRVAIDDFGVGYSNLSRFNLHYTRLLKIDRSIIEGCPNDRQASTICIAAINLASSLGLLSLAEGVENVNQVRFLTKYGCALAQGFYFAEAVPPAEISNFYRTKKIWKV